MKKKEVSKEIQDRRDYYKKARDLEKNAENSEEDRREYLKKKTAIIHQQKDNEIIRPVTSYLAAEVADKADKEFEESNTYKELMQKKLLNQFNSKRSKLSKVGSYIYRKIYDNQVLSRKVISRDLGISIVALSGYISKLNQFRGYPLTLIPVVGKRGFIRAVTTSYSDYNYWASRKKKTIYSLETTLDKGIAQGEATFEKDHVMEELKENKEKILLERN